MDRVKKLNEVPVNSQQYLEPTPYDKPVPPPGRRSAGRPKKNRRKDVNEEPIAGQKLKKTYNDTQCSMCGLFGHNTRGCMKQGVTRRPKNWVDSEPEQPAEGNNEAVDNVNVAAGGNVNVVAAGNEAGGNINAMVQHAHAHAGTTVQQGISTRRYGMRGPVISNERVKQPPVRGHAPPQMRGSAQSQVRGLAPPQVRGPSPPQTTTPGLIRVPYPGYEASGSSQPQFMEFIPTPGLPPKKP